MSLDRRPVVHTGFTISRWDRSHDWIVERIYDCRVHAAVRFQARVPTGQELLALRRLLPQVRDMSPAELKVSIGDSGVLPLGEMYGREARHLVPALQASGFHVDVQDLPSMFHRFEDQTTGTLWINEDPVEAATIAESMLAAGVPLRLVET